MSAEPDWSAYPDFSRAEFVCSCGCGRAEMHPAILDVLQAIRTRYGKPMVVTSGYRCPAYNDRISSSGRQGPHTQGVAVDLKVAGNEAYEVLALALRRQVPRIGISQRGPHEGRFLHLDVLDTPTSPWVWSY